ncbi:MAG: hypothetical protein ICV68_11495, partial [Pyrinomonadaceae bacterium]|nr:hypothetical protein [Pyrinomonadaceae bacterium]
SKNNQLYLIPLPLSVVKGYEYKVQLRNAADKPIKAVQWSYIFTDPLTHQQLVRHEFYSRIQIPPGREKKLSIFTKNSPPKVVDVKELSSRDGKQWDESVVVGSIEYADGSVWKPSSSQAGPKN